MGGCGGGGGVHEVDGRARIGAVLQPVFCCSCIRPSQPPPSPPPPAHAQSPPPPSSPPPPPLGAEDAPSGVEAATAAGCRVVVVPSQLVEGKAGGLYPPANPGAQAGCVALLPSLLDFRPERFGLPPYTGACARGGLGGGGRRAEVTRACVERGGQSACPPRHAPTPPHPSTHTHHRIHPHTHPTRAPHTQTMWGRRCRWRRPGASAGRWCAGLGGGRGSWASPPPTWHQRR